MALALGKTVGQLLAEVSSVELTEWLAYYRLEPFGEAVADQRMGIHASLLANVNRDPKQKRDPFKPNDFIPWHESHLRAHQAMLLGDPEAQSKLIKEALFGART